MRNYIAGLAAALILLSSSIAFAAEVPANDGYVTDDTGTLSADQESTLEQNLSEYDRATSNQVAILMVRSLSGTILSDFSVDVMRKWGIGQKGKDNGILILVSLEDRARWIATGTGLEGAVPDLVAKGIVEKDMVPAFADGQYFDGLNAAVESLKKHIAGEYTADRYTESEGGVVSWVLFFFFILLNWIAASLARTKSWWAGGIVGGIFGIILTVAYTWWWTIPVLVIIGLIFDYVVSHASGKNSRGGRWGGGFGGFGGSSGGGGGFSGFGGGSSSGGGAGGRY